MIALLCPLIAGVWGGVNCGYAQTVSERNASSASPEAQRSAADTLSRAERWRRKRQKKARESQSSEAGFFAQMDEYVVNTAVSIIPTGLVFEIPKLKMAGFRPVIKEVGGGQFTAGVLYEPPFLDEKNRFLNVEAVGGSNRYYSAKVLYGAEWDQYVGYAYARYQHRPSESFFGIGPDTRQANESTFRLNEGIFGGLGGRRLGENAMIGGHLSYQFNRFGAGRGSETQTATRFEGVPGVKNNVDHFMAGVFFEYDSRDTPYNLAYGQRFAPTENRLRSVSLNASRGFYLSGSVTHNVDTRLREHDFTRFTLDAREIIPIDEELFHGFAFRQFVSLTRTAGGDQVPFYRQQPIGGSRSLRGFATDRFRDRNVMLVNAEVRCEIWHRLDMALFTDAGHTFNDFGNAELDDPQVGYGIGFRIKKDDRTLGRIDVARSNEGITTTLNLGSLF